MSAVNLSLAIAAPPLLALILLLWTLERAGGRSGWRLFLSMMWGGFGATSLAILVSATWLEQPAWYPYLVTPVVEEVAKALILVILTALGLIAGSPVGLAYGLACGLGFALWENAAYFDRLGTTPSSWLYLTRTTGTALLHASATALVGAAAGFGGPQTSWRRRMAALVAALAFACLIHGSWNYVCVVLSDTSTLRRALPALWVTLLVALVAWSMRRERWRLRREILALWRENTIAEPIARALLERWPTRALRRSGVEHPRKVNRAAWQLALARRQLASLPQRSEAARARLIRLAQHWQDMLDSLLSGRDKPPARRSQKRDALLIVGLALAAGVVHLLGQVSPVPAALARRTVVITSGAKVRPEPLLSVVDENQAYILWQRGPSRDKREQVLTWIGPGNERRDLGLGPVPPQRDDWFDMTTLGDHAVIATRQGDRLLLRRFLKNHQVDRLPFDAPERDPEPCWPWLTTDQGRTLVGWDRLRAVAWLKAPPLELGPPLKLPNPFPEGIETADQACARGFMLTDQTVYQVAKPSKASRLAAVDLEELTAHPIDLCPGQPGLRVHSLDKDRGQVLVLLGGQGPEGYRLLLARLDRSGHLISPCRPVRTMPAGEPAVVSLSGAGDNAFLAWATSFHIFLARIPLSDEGDRSRRWVLDRAPPDSSGVVRVGVTEGRLYVAWEGHSEDDRWSLKLLRSEIADLP